MFPPGAVLGASLSTDTRLRALTMYLTSMNTNHIWETGKHELYLVHKESRNTKPYKQSDILLLRKHTLIIYGYSAGSPLRVDRV